MYSGNTERTRPIMSFQDEIAILTKTVCQSVTQFVIIFGQENCWKATPFF